jgi:hypothetical protein
LPAVDDLKRANCKTSAKKMIFRAPWGYCFFDPEKPSFWRYFCNFLHNFHSTYWFWAKRAHGRPFSIALVLMFFFIDNNYARCNVLIDRDLRLKSSHYRNDKREALLGIVLGGVATLAVESIIVKSHIVAPSDILRFHLLVAAAINCIVGGAIQPLNSLARFVLESLERTSCLSRPIHSGAEGEASCMITRHATEESPPFMEKVFNRFAELFK